MPFYRFFVHGSDPCLPDEVHGFYTTRHAWGTDEAQAARKVLDRLKLEFTTGRSARKWAGCPPAITIEEGWRIGWHQLWSAPNRGSVFYDSRIEGLGEEEFRILP